MALKFVFFTFWALFPIGGLLQAGGVLWMIISKFWDLSPLQKRSKTKNKTKDKNRSFPFGFFPNSTGEKFKGK